MPIDSFTQQQDILISNQGHLIKSKGLYSSNSLEGLIIIVAVHFCQFPVHLDFCNVINALILASNEDHFLDGDNIITDPMKGVNCVKRGLIKGKHMELWHGDSIKILLMMVIVIMNGWNAAVGEVFDFPFFDKYLLAFLNCINQDTPISAYPNLFVQINLFLV